MIPEAGDIVLADLGAEQPQLVLVLSSARFNRIAERAMVAPAAAKRPFPWRIDNDGQTFAVDLLKTVPTDVLLAVKARASQDVTRRAQRAVRLVM